MDECNEREMTLEEWCGKLSKFHLVNKEFEALKKEAVSHQTASPSGSTVAPGYAVLMHKMADQLKAMRKLHDPNGGCHCQTCLQVVALEYEYDNLINPKAQR